MRPTKHALLALVFLSLSCAEKPEPLAPELARARELVDQNRASEAYPLLKTAVDENPESVEHLVLFAETCRALGRTPRGVRAAEKARALAPEHPRALYVSALLDLDRERLADAHEWIHRAIQYDPERVDYYLLAGDLALRSADPGGAVEAFRAARRIAPDDPRVVGGLGRALIDTGEHDKGLSYIEAYLRQRPHDGGAHYLRGVAKFRQGDYEEAEREFRRAIALTPYLPGPHHNLARILQMSGRADEAREVREKHREVNERDLAIRTAQRRLGNDPKDLETARTLQRLLEEAGRTAEAAELRARLEGT